MNASDRWHELERLYHAALERPSGERTAFVIESCAHDTGLRVELESMLAHDQPGDEFLEQPAIDVAARALTSSEVEPAALQPGSLIGPYKILEQLARGGMGVVYRAGQQHPVRRNVALKIIKPGMDSEHVIARFQAERQALALMDHPNIARVLDAGTTDSGRLYFVMELVDGLPVTEYCRQHNLNLRDRLALFLPICQAIQHAHQKGIIHRDIKPSNVLVTTYDGKPVPKVIDFGIAKAMQEPLTDRSLHTQFGAVVGTLEYMSPEQAGSTGEDIDTRSDVYSLGVLLYELITGSTPLNRATLGSISDLELVRRICEDAPSPPSARIADARLSRAVAGDLDWVVMKALDKDRSRRYETVNGLARDLERYLAGEPVEAAPPSVAYQMRKFARRHRAGLLTAAAFAALLVGGVVVSSRMAIRASRAEQEALAVNNFLQDDLLAQASAFAQTGLSTKPDPDLTVRTALDRAAARIDGKFDHQPEVEASIRDTIGQTYLDIGLFPEARKHLERALELHNRDLGPENPKSVKTLTRLARTTFSQGKYPQAETQYLRTLDISRRVLGAEHPDTLVCMTGLALDYRVQAKFSEALSMQSKALEIQRRVLGPEHRDTLMSMGNLAIVYFQQGKYAEAEPIYHQALEIQRRVLGPEHPDTIRSMGNLAIDYILQGKYGEAEMLMSQTLQIRRRLLGPEHPQTLSSMNNLAGVYFSQGKYTQAEALYGEALDTHRRVMGAEHPDTLMYMNNLALAYDAEGHDTQAEALFSRTLDLRNRVLGPRHPFTLSTLSYMAFMYQRQRRYNQAETYAEKALDGLRHALGSENPETMAAASDLALIYVSQGKFAKSEPLAREAMEIDRRKRPDDWQRFRAESLLGTSLAGEKKVEEAGPLLAEGYREMLARKSRMRVPDLYHLERAKEWLANFKQSRAANGN